MTDYVHGVFSDGTPLCWNEPEGMKIEDDKSLVSCPDCRDTMLSLTSHYESQLDTLIYLETCFELSVESVVEDFKKASWRSKQYMRGLLVGRRGALKSARAEKALVESFLREVGWR